MAKLDRKDVKIFAENSKETLITEFRTEDSQGSTASFSRDPDVIQNENYSQGWVNDTNNLNTKIYGEDLNAVNYVLSYLLKYLYENGIAEWKNTTTYYQNSICKVNNALYLSLQNDNIGNDPTSTISYWKLIPLENVSIENSGSGFNIVKDVTDNVITFKTISVTGYGEITDNGDQLNIDISGGGGGGSGDAYWGTIRGTITNQTDLMALINLKQDIFTVDSPLVLTDDQHLTINKATSNVSGYLDYQDFNTFNNKQDTISATLPISITNNNIEIETADTSTTGALSYTDWNTFNNKQNKIQGVQFYYDDSIIKQEPNTNRTSYLGSDLHPYNNSYIDKIYTSTINPIGDNATVTISEPRIANIRATTNGGTIVVQDNMTFNYKRLSIVGAGLDISNGVKIEFGYNYINFTEDNKYSIGNGSRKALAMFSYAFNGASDIRYKDNIKTYDECVLDKLDKINPITFNYKNHDINDVRLGVSAQELKEVEPLCVKGGETKSGDEPLTVDMMQLVVFNLKAIKELKAKVEKLESRVNELEENIKELNK